MKKNIAVLFGGCSPEYHVSLESAYAVITNLNRDKYLPVPIGISEAGDWYYFSGCPDKIRENTWLNPTDCIPAMINPSPREHSLTLFMKQETTSIPLDAAFPVLHGKNGEDGTVQGLISLAQIPLAGCGILASALCMDKDRAHRLVEAGGILVPKSLVILPGTDKTDIAAFADDIGYPLFVKPVKAGSSFGVTKVSCPKDLMQAVQAAFAYDDQVIIEEHIPGFEVGCAILGNTVLTVGEVDEVELSGGFFDFTEKYTLKTSAIHVPARIACEKSDEVKETAKRIYRILGCWGFARVDMFLTPKGRIVFNEVNTIPGFTEHSRFPGMMKAAGISFPEILERAIEQAVKP